jgi:hypothetical protein
MRKVLAQILVGCILFAGTAHAADDADPAVQQARKEYAAGKEAYASKRYAEAAQHFEAAASSRPHAVTLYTAALAWDAAGKPERAADAFSRSLDVPGLDPKQMENAKARLAALEPTLGTLAVKGPDGTKVQLEGLTETTTPAKLHAPPGTHILMARLPGDKPVVRKEVQLEAGQVTPFELKDDSPPPTTAPKETPKEEPKQNKEPPPQHTAAAPFPMRRAIGIGVAGLGVGMLVGGTVLGVSALSAKDAYNAGPTREAFDHANSLATWTTVALIAGGVLTAGGVALAIIPEKEEPPKNKMTFSISPFGALVTGAF